MTDQQIAEHVCNSKEYEAWILRHRGMSQRNIALTLNITRWAARDRIDAAAAKIADYRRRHAA